MASPQKLTPRYIQIRADLMKAIDTGSLHPGDRAPSERELTQQYSVSRMTARHALSTLESEGYLTRVPGSGTFVSQPKFEQKLNAVTSFTEEVQLHGMTPDTRVVSTAIIEADQRIAEKMGLPVGTPIIQFQRVRLANGTPMALETSNLPLHRFPGLAQINLAHESLYRVLRETYQFKPARASQSIEVMVAGTFEAGLLGVRSSAPLLLLERTTHDADDSVAEYVRSFYRGDRYRFVTELR
ncbi:MAG TPA: GntR family transcriptional regulator [Symbiobacteriaceae bacterium]|jgi:GntR family transcriptional regulator|nr:GntR family transcriptional regulator [Symbiobacteriaceae bacterium]